MRNASAATTTKRARTVCSVPSVRSRTTTPSRSAVLDEHAGHQRLGDEREVGVAPCGLAEDDGGTAPDELAVGPRVDRERHGRDPAAGRAALVELGGEAAAHLVGVGRVREGVLGDAEQPLALVEQLLQVGQEADQLPLARPRAGARPVGAHAADVGRHRAGRQAVLARHLEVALEQLGAGPDDPLARVRVAAGARRSRCAAAAPRTGAAPRGARPRRRCSSRGARADPRAAAPPRTSRSCGPAPAR